MKRKISFPSAFTVLFIILIFAAVLTHIVPSGMYSRLSYEASSNEFIITSPDGSESTLNANSENLEKLNIHLDISKFVDGVIKKPIAIPDTYERLEQRPQGIIELFKSPIRGILDTTDIMIFVLILGGIIGLLNKSGAFDAGMAYISKKSRGKEFLLVSIVFVLTTLGGTTFGLAEETIAFYPVLMPLFLVNGFDPIICISAIYMGSTIGTMVSTVNPFSVVIASNAAGISFNEGLIFRIVMLILCSAITLAYMYYYAKKVRNKPELSLVYESRESINNRFLKNYDANQNIEFTFRKKLMLIIFALSFILMVWGVSSAGWWFEEMSTLFLVVGIIEMILSGMGEKEAVNTFVGGAAELVGVALMVGLARSINIIMDDGLISDTLLYYSSNLVSSMGKGLFSLVMYIIYIFLGFFINSSSGLAVLSMPIMAPLADTVGISRSIVVDAYNWGQGLIGFITPTGLILVSLEMAETTFDKWLKFILPLMAIIGVFCAVMLYVEALL